ncbi:MAG: oligosaccharide flippase family protein [Acidimicrobiales bacterium]|nr:oligosaccharide flippase family protein [Acidimicrobiales bacterium]
MTDPNEIRQVNKNDAFTGAFMATSRFFLTTVIGIPTTIALVRLLDPSQFGYWVVATAIVGLLTSFASSGLGSATSKLVSLEKARGNSEGEAGIVRTAHRAALFVAILTSLLVLVVGFIIFYFAKSGSQVVLLFAVLSPYVIFIPFYHVAIGNLFANAKPKKIEGSHIIGSVTFLIGIGIALTFSRSAIWIALARSVSMLLSYLFVIKGLKIDRRVRPIRMREFVSNSASALMNSLGFSAVNRLDVLVLGTAVSVTDSGLYGPLSSLASMAQSIATLPASYFLPSAIKSIFEKDRHAILDLYTTVTRAGILLSGPVLVVLIAIPNQVLGLALGARYSHLAFPARILSIGIAFQIFSGPNGTLLFAFNKLKLFTIRSVVTFCMSVAGCIVLVPMFKLTGAALATTLPLVVSNLISSITIYLAEQIYPSLIKTGLPVLAIFASVAIVVVVAAHTTSQPIAVMTGLILGFTIPLAVFLTTLTDSESQIVSKYSARLKRN